MTTIQDFPDYTIDEYGTVTNKHGHIMTQLINRNGYFRVHLTKNGTSYGKSIHRLLGETFIPNPENKPCIDHIDRNKQNNSLDNLRWVTYSENGQNRTISTNNISCHKYISFNKKCNNWRFKKIINGKGFQKYFKTLEEAIEYKNEFLLKINYVG